MPIAEKAAAALRAVPRWIADGLLPPLCLACDRPVVQSGLLCGPCWGAVNFIAPPYCRRCGYPFEYDSGPEALCGPCVREAPPYSRARAAMRYDEYSKALIIGFKHADRTEAAGRFGAWLRQAGGDLIAEAELVTAVPLHWRRLLKRRYNQAALLAGALTEAHGGLEFRPDLLLRTKATPPQGRLTRQQRRDNLRGAIALNPARRDVLGDKRVLLIDDVMTTGATLEACSRALLKAGARSVDVLVLARVLLPRT